MRPPQHSKPRQRRSQKSQTRYVLCGPITRYDLTELGVLKVNKSVGRGLASALETGDQVTEKTEQALGKRAFVPYPGAVNECGALTGATKDQAARGVKSTAEKTAAVSFHFSNFRVFRVVPYGLHTTVLA
jgi:hypothetical protein